MTLRNKLLLNFGLLILFTLILFGFSAYQEAYRNAIDKDRQLLENHILLDSERYSVILRDNKSLDEIISDFSVHSDGSHFHTILDEEFGLVNKGSVESAILKLFSSEQLKEIMDAEDGSGEITVNHAPYVWAKAALKDSRYSVLYIEESFHHNEKGLNNLASRLFVIALIILDGLVIILIHTPIIFLSP